MVHSHHQNLINGKQEEQMSERIPHFDWEGLRIV